MIVAKASDYKGLLKLVGSGDGNWLPVEGSTAVTFCSVCFGDPRPWSSAEFDDCGCDGDSVAETGYADCKGRVAMCKVGGAVKGIDTP